MSACPFPLAGFRAIKTAWFVIAVLLLFGSGAAVGQETAEEPPRLSTADIEQRLDDVRIRLGDARRAIDEARYEDDAIDQTLDELEKALSETIRSIEENIETFNPLVFDQIRQTLESRARQAEAWNTEISEYTSRLANLRSALRVDAEFVAVVLSPDQAEDLPTVLAERTEAVSRDIDKTRDALAEKLNQSVSVRGRIVEYQASMDAARSELEAAGRGRRGPFAGLDGAPLHQAVQENWQQPRDAFRENIAILGKTWNEYRQSNATDLILLLASLPLLFLLIWFLRSSVVERATGAVPERERRLLIERPVAATLIVWLGLGPEALGMRLPWVLVDVVGITTLLVSIRLLPVLIRQEYRRPVGALLVVCALDLAASIIYPVGPAQRAIAFATTLAGIIFMRRLMVAADSVSAEGKSRWSGPVAKLARFGFVALVLSLFADIIGAVTLAEQIFFGVLMAILVVVSVIAIELVLRSAWEIALESQTARKLNAVRRCPDLIRRRGILVLRVLLFMLLIDFVPDIFPTVGFIGNAISDLITQEWTFGNIQLSIEALLLLVVGLAMAVYVSRFFRFMLEEDVVPRLPVDQGAGAAASRLIYYVLVIVGVALALASAGLEFNQVALIIGALGVGIGFGLQNIVNDFVSGIVVAFERPFKVGDTIEVGELWGRVRHIGLRASTIRTYEGAEVIVPNASLISGQVINWTLSDRRRRIDIPVGVAYGSDPEQVQKILVEAVAGHAACLDDPPPKALFRDFGDSALNFELRFWTPDAEKRLETYSEVAISVNAALKAAGISIPFPQRDLHLQTVTGKDISIK